MRRHLLEARREAIHADERDWWLHFDWLATQKGQRNLLSDSAGRLRDLADSGRHRLFLLVLQSLWEPNRVLSELEPTLLQTMEGPDDAAWESIHVLAGMICVRERMERGELTDEFKRLFAQIARHLDACAGSLPGRLALRPWDALRDRWIALSCTLSLRLGETPTPVIRETLPDLIWAFREMQSQPSLPPAMPLRPSQYSRELADLLSLYERSGRRSEAQRVFSTCAAYTTSSPQLETLRLVTMAIAQHNAAHPTHHVKGSLLAALKLVNGVTQNAQMKVLVLLLVGRLYVETDFELALKMNRAAYSFAVGAGWELLAHLAAQALGKVYRLVGDRPNWEQFEAAAATHRAALAESTWQRVVAPIYEGVE